MTDTSQRPPSITSFKSMVATGVASAASGDQIGNAIGDIISWYVALSCNCTVPAAVTSAVHTITVALVVLAAFVVHYLIVKQNGE